MAIPKKYFQDRSTLLLISFSVFLVIVGSTLILLKLDSGRSDGYIIQYRANLGISAFKTGDLTSVLSFIGFLLVILVAHVSLSMRVYNARRHAAVAVLALGVLLLVLAVVISNALLVLR
jgi:hypothetical protein